MPMDSSENKNIQVEQERMEKHSSLQEFGKYDEKKNTEQDESPEHGCEVSDRSMPTLEIIPQAMVETIYIKEEPNDDAYSSSHDPIDDIQANIEESNNSELKFDSKYSSGVLAIPKDLESGSEQKMAKYCKIGGLYRCEHCTFTTPNKKKLRQHYNLSHKKMDKKNCRQCLHCNYVTADPSELDRHFYRYHDKSELTCLFCPFNSTDKQQLEEHIASHQKNISRQCPHCPYVATNSKQFNAHVRFHFSEETLKCSHCLYLTDNRRALNLHMKRHTGSGFYSCPSCPFRTIYATCMKTHKKIHLRNSWEKCLYCSFKTHRKSHMVYHMSKHTKENLLTCNLCGFKTPYKQNMDYHVSIHTKKGFLKCELCNYTTLKKFYLDSHVKSKHTREGLLECKECDFKTAHKHHLMNHMSVHFKQGSLTCPVCKVFSDEKDGTFLDHLKVEHKDVKRLNCNQCSLVTKSRGVMLRHLRLHKGQRAVVHLFGPDYQKRTYLRSKDVQMVETNEEPSVDQANGDDAITLEQDRSLVKREINIKVEEIDE